MGAVAELERSLIVERVKAGLRNARAKGKRLGRRRVAVDSRRIATLRKAAKYFSADLVSDSATGFVSILCEIG